MHHPAGLFFSSSFWHRLGGFVPPVIHLVASDSYDPEHQYVFPAQVHLVAVLQPSTLSDVTYEFLMVVERLRKYQLHSLLYTLIAIMSYNGPSKAFLWLKKQFIIIS